eukprot:6478171-Amphidinium_carterae.1
MPPLRQQDTQTLEAGEVDSFTVDLLEEVPGRCWHKDPNSLLCSSSPGERFAEKECARLVDVRQAGEHLKIVSKTLQWIPSSSIGSTHHVHTLAPELGARKSHVSLLFNTQPWQHR